MKIQTKLLLIVSIMILVSVTACDTKVVTDYDRDADFSSIGSYAWYEIEHPDISDLENRRIISIVDEQLQAKGLHKVDSDPDVYIVYFGDSDESVVIDTTHHGYGFGAGWYWGGGMGMGSSTSRIRTYTEGTLVIDMYKAGEKMLIWRGSLSGTVTDNPQEMEKKVRKGLAKLFKKYPPEKRS